MEVREMTEEDRKLAIRWVSLRAGANAPEDMFPHTGAAVVDGGVVRLVQTVFFEGTSAMAVLGWCAGNPNNLPRESLTAFRLAIGFTEGYAIRHGARHLIGIYGDPGLSRQLDRLGFVSGDSDVQQKYKRMR